MSTNGSYKYQYLYITGKTINILYINETKLDEGINKKELYWNPQFTLYLNVGLYVVK